MAMACWSTEYLEKEKRTMNKIRMTVFALVLALLPLASVHGQAAQQSFGFNAARISGFPTGAAFLTGGGAYNLERAFLKTGGGFRCLEDINQGPLKGCLAGEGIRWDAKEGATQLFEIGLRVAPESPALCPKCKPSAHRLANLPPLRAVVRDQIRRRKRAQPG